MGKRLHREAVSAGQAAPYRSNWKQCLLCGEWVPEYDARPHIRMCWQYPIGETGPLPREPIVYRDGKLMPDWKQYRNTV